MTGSAGEEVSPAPFYYSISEIVIKNGPDDWYIM